MGKKLARASGAKPSGRQEAKRRKGLMLGGILAAALIVVLVAGSLAMSASGPSKLVANGEAAPGFTLPRLGSPGSLTLEGLKGKVVVLNFWHSQ